MAPDGLPLWEQSLPVLLDPAGPPPAQQPRVTRTAPVPRIRGGRLPKQETESAASEAARQVLAAAQAEAAQILARAEAQAAQIAENARQEAIRAACAEQEAVLRHLISQIRENLAEQIRVHWAELEREAARLCADLAQAIVRRKVAEDDETVVNAVREGLSRMAGARTVTVRLNPQSEAAVAAVRQDLLREVPSILTLEIVPDPAIQQGGALLQSSNGDIDLQIETQLQRLREAVLAAVERETVVNEKESRKEADAGE